jgi:hypothetical protein
VHDANKNNLVLEENPDIPGHTQIGDLHHRSRRILNRRKPAGSTAHHCVLTPPTGVQRLLCVDRQRATGGDGGGQSLDLELIENTDVLKRQLGADDAGRTSAERRVANRRSAQLSHTWGNRGRNVGSGPVITTALAYPDTASRGNFPEGDLKVDQRHRAGSGRPTRFLEQGLIVSALKR